MVIKTRAAEVGCEMCPFESAEPGARPILARLKTVTVVRFSAVRPLLIAISGYGDKEACPLSYESGIDLHLIKPVDPTKVARPAAAGSAV